MRFQRRDLYRAVSLCAVNGKDISETMVGNGMAAAFRNADGTLVYGGKDYASAEQKAKDQKIGLWSMTDFMNPAEWRKICKGRKDASKLKACL